MCILPVGMAALLILVRMATVGSPSSISKESRFVAVYAAQKLPGLTFHNLQQRLTKKDPSLGFVVDIDVLPTREDRVMGLVDVGIDLCFSAICANIPLAFHVLQVWSTTPTITSSQEFAKIICMPILVAIVQLFLLLSVMSFSGIARIFDANRPRYVVIVEILIGILSFVVAGLFMGPLLQL